MRSKKLQGLPLVFVLSSSTTSTSTSTSTSHSLVASNMVHYGTEHRQGIVAKQSAETAGRSLRSRFSSSLRRHHPVSSISLSDPSSSSTLAAASSETATGETEWVEAVNKIRRQTAQQDLLIDRRRHREESGLLEEGHQSLDQVVLHGDKRILHRGGDYDTDSGVLERDAGPTGNYQNDPVVDRGTVDPSTTTSSTSHLGGAGNGRIQQTKRLHSPLSATVSAIAKQSNIDEDGGDQEENQEEEFDIESNTQSALVRHDDHPQEQDVEGDSIFFPSQQQEQQQPQQQEQQQQSTSESDPSAPAPEANVTGDNIFATDFGDDDDDEEEEDDRR